MKFKQLLLGGLVVTASTTFANVIFSEYIEGSSNNKALELMNTGSTPVDLSTYTIELYSNGNLAVQNSLDLSGSLDAGKVYVIANASASSDILTVADTTSTVTYFNGNDVLLLKNNGAVIDRIGQLGNADYFGSEVTLVRKEIITSGDSAYNRPFDPTLEWDAYPQNTFAYLGNGDNDTTEPPVDLVCNNPATLISEIQGNSDSSPLNGELVVVEAIVTASMQGNGELNGFFIQEEEADADSDANTSEGLFVYYRDTLVNVGDKVRLYGQVDEYYDLTELTQVQALKICSQNNALPTVTPFNLPVTALTDFETVEGMQIAITETMTVNEVYNLGRYGQFMISQGRRQIPTDAAEPGDAADAIRAANALNTLLVDDGMNSQNPDPVIFPAPGLDALNTLRVGYTVNHLTGVMHYANSAFKLIPKATPEFEASGNPRTVAPEPIDTSNLRIASYNVLNYFNGDGEGGGFPTIRGAHTAYEFERQTTKLVAAINALEADIIGLMEMENDGFGELSAIATLTARLNAELPNDLKYDYVRPELASIGTDVITIGLLYRPAKIDLSGKAKTLDSSNSPLDENGAPLFIDSLNRPILAQTMIHKASGERITVSVGHLKSKRADNCADFNDCDEGQGAYNKIRTKAANAIAIWLSTEFDAEKNIILGDLNAYSKEDPISALLDADYSLLKEKDGHSYVYNGETGTIDHALVNHSLLANVLAVQHWNINTDEPRVLDYNTEYKTEQQILSLYAPDAYRSSDHDPVVVDFRMNAAPTAVAQVIPFFFWYVFISDSQDTDGFIVDETWTLGETQINRPWFAVPRHYIMRNRINQVTLTVYDNDNASSTTTETIGCFSRHCGRPHRAHHHF